MLPNVLHYLELKQSLLEHCISYSKCRYSVYFTNNTICRPNFIKSYFTIYYLHFKNYLSILRARLLLTFAIPSLLVLFVSLDLNLNNSESIMFLFGSSLQYCNKPADSFSYLSHIFKLAL